MIASSCLSEFCRTRQDQACQDIFFDLLHRLQQYHKPLSMLLEKYTGMTQPGVPCCSVCQYVLPVRD